MNKPQLTHELFNQLDLAVALMQLETKTVVSFNNKFKERCLAHLDSDIQSGNALADIQQVIPQLNIELLERSFARRSKYRTTISFISNGIECPVDFIFEPIESESQKIVLIQGVDNPQSLEINGIINSYDAIFKTQANELKLEKQKSQQANEVKSQFLSRMSHELRTPMNAILGFAQLQQLQLNPESELKHFNDEILNAGLDLLELIEKMFNFVEIDDHKQHLTLEPLELRHCFNQAFSQSQQQAQNKNIEVNIKPTDIKLQADQDKLIYILTELIKNGIKFCDANSKIELAASSSQDQARITVSDNGDHLTSEELEQLFTPFFRSKHAQENEISGIGIGLVLCKQFVEHMNGHICSTIVPNRSGLTFVIKLPLAA